jgi:hypothetical protein
MRLKKEKSSLCNRTHTVKKDAWAQIKEFFGWNNSKSELETELETELGW